MVDRDRRSIASLLLGASLLLASCSIVRVEGRPDPAEIPAGPLEALGPAAVGPVVELGSGRTAGVGWRSSAYESDAGTCTQLELAATTSTTCGDIGGWFRDGPIGSVGRGGPDPSGDLAMAVEGVVTSEVVQVWIVTDTGRRIPTSLLSMAAAGHDAQAFVGFVPAGVTATSVVATDDGGKALGTSELP